MAFSSGLLNSWSGQAQPLNGLLGAHPTRSTPAPLPAAQRPPAFAGQWGSGSGSFTNGGTTNGVPGGTTGGTTGGLAGFRPYQPMAPGLTYDQQLAIIQGFARNAGLLGAGGASSDPPPRSTPAPLPAPQTPTPGSGSFNPGGAGNLDQWLSQNPNATQAQLTDFWKSLGGRI